MEIVRSVWLSEIDPVFLETSYYVVPDKGGEKAYALLFGALQARGHIALARASWPHLRMHGSTTNHQLSKRPTSPWPRPAPLVAASGYRRIGWVTRIARNHPAKNGLVRDGSPGNEAGQLFSDTGS